MSRKMPETINWVAVYAELPPQGHDVQAWDAKSNTWTSNAMCVDKKWREYTQSGFGDGMGWYQMQYPPTHWAEKPKGPKS